MLITITLYVIHKSYKIGKIFLRTPWVFSDDWFGWGAGRSDADLVFGHDPVRVLIVLNDLCVREGQLRDGLLRDLQPASRC